MAESLLHLPLHLTLEVLNILRHLSVLRHKVVLLRKLRDVIVWQLIGRRTNHVVLLAEYGTGRVLRYVRDQAVQLGEGLIARIAMIMILAFQFAEWPAATLLRSVEGVR